jgi:predicted nucleic acid-binding protein
VKVVADSSPLMILAKLNVFDLLPKLYPRVHISAEVYAEVVVAGAGLPGADSVAKAGWIEVKPIQNPAQLPAAESRFNVGVGELSTIILARELKAELILVDDLRARRLAKSEGLEIRGTVGLLELLYRRRDILDLRSTFRQLLSHAVYVDRTLLNRRLHVLTQVNQLPDAPPRRTGSHSLPLHPLA